MRVLTYTIVAIAAGSIVPVYAADRAAMRPAKTAEIGAHLSLEQKQTTTKSNGFIYAKGKDTGYKISNGQICVRFKTGRVDCADVKTDGTRFQMITKDGTRTGF